jgi:hypothetical protein
MHCLLWTNPKTTMLLKPRAIANQSESSLNPCCRKDSRAGSSKFAQGVQKWS